VASLRRPSLRLALGLAVIVIGLLEIQGLAQTLRSQSRLRERITNGVRDGLLAARPRLAESLRPGGEASWTAAADEVLRASLASEVEVFDTEGRALLRKPRAAPVEHWPTADERQLVLNDSVLVVGPITRRYSRLLSYAAFRSGGQTVFLRLSTAVPELIDDLNERRGLLLGHGIALIVLMVAGALVLFPERREDRAAPEALSAYEEAMGRLRDQGAELSREHAAERSRMEAMLGEKEALARAGELTAGIAHEVRNGLGTILGYARLLERGAAAPDVADTARSIREECEVLEVVVRRFMDYVKRESLNLASFDLGRMLARVAARETRDGPPVRLPEPPPGAIVGDEELLERAFENIVRNASEAAGRHGRVEVTVTLDAGQLTVDVLDDGPGFPDGGPQQPRPFFTTKAGGLGLGLPLADKIVRLHQGQLALSRRSPRGTAVSVTLPIEGPSK